MPAPKNCRSNCHSDPSLLLYLAASLSPFGAGLMSAAARFAVWGLVLLVGCKAGYRARALRPTARRFPWPPPAASAFTVLPRELITQHRKATLGDGASRIETALDQNGYSELTFYPIPMDLRSSARGRDISARSLLH